MKVDFISILFPIPRTVNASKWLNLERLEELAEELLDFTNVGDLERWLDV